MVEVLLYVHNVGRELCVGGEGEKRGVEGWEKDRERERERERSGSGLGGGGGETERIGGGG